MNFQDLYKKIADLDKPVSEAQIEECGMDGPMGATEMPKTQPSMSVNINAQGMDDIAELMKLISKVNPDMGHEEMPMAAVPAIEIEPMDKPAGMHPPMSDLLATIGKHDEPENDGQDIDGVDIGSGEEPEMGHDEPEEESWGNAPTDAAGPETKDQEFMTRTLAGGMNKEKNMAKHSYKSGDNPYAMPESDLRTQIRAELMKRLEETKSGLVERDEGKHNNGKTTGFKAVAKKAAKEYGSKAAGERVAGAVRAKMAKAGKL